MTLRYEEINGNSFTIFFFKINFENFLKSTETSIVIQLWVTTHIVWESLTEGTRNIV